MDITFTINLSGKEEDTLAKALSVVDNIIETMRENKLSAIETEDGVLTFDELCSFWDTLESISHPYLNCLI